MSTAEILAELPRLTPEELAAVQAKLDELVGATAESTSAYGIWRDRTDLPEDPVEASKMLRAKMMGRNDA